VLLKDVIEKDFRSLWIVATALIVMGIRPREQRTRRSHATTR
jgi:undecaprenyl pyrophosphate phosphatase UppP